MRTVTTLAISLLPAALAAQTTHQVGPGGFAQIRAALQVAAPGDVVLVQPGTYEHFECTVGVTIRAAVPGTVDVEWTSAYMPPGCSTSGPCLDQQGATRFQVPAGQVAHVVGLTFAPNQVAIGLFAVAHRVEVVGAHVTFDGCTIASAARAALTVDGGVVHLQDCELRGENGLGVLSPAMRANAATVTAVDTVFLGAPAGGGFYASSEAVALQSSTLHGSGVQLVGGAAGFASPALRMTASRAWLADSSLAAGAVCPVDVTGGAPQLDRCVVTTLALNCVAHPAASPLLGAGRPQPITRGASFSVPLRTAPNGLVGVFASTALAISETPPVVAQPSYLSPIGLVAAGLGVADATGAFAPSWSVPSNPALVDQAFWFQAVSGTALPLQQGPVVGGVVR